MQGFRDSAVLQTPGGVYWDLVASEYKAIVIYLVALHDHKRVKWPIHDYYIQHQFSISEIC